MAACPRCGIEVEQPTKTWAMAGKPSKKGERFKLTLGLFVCPRCQKTFRTVLGKEKEKITLKGMIDEIKGIEKKLATSAEELKEKLEELRTERSELLNEITGLKKTGTEKAQTLEQEIISLREELDSLKDFLDNK